MEGPQIARVYYTFLDSITNEPKNVKDVVEELNLIVDIFSNLQIYIEGLKSTATANGEYPAIPVSVARNFAKGRV